MDNSKEIKHTFAVCAYKESPYLEECLESLTRQNRPTENPLSKIIICTATPNDFIENLAHKYNYQLFVNSAKPGIGSDWNFALSCVDTPLATIAHQDDIYEPAYAMHAINALLNSKHPLLFFSNYGEIRSDNKVTESRLLAVKRIMLSPIKNGRFSSFKILRRRILSLGSAICCPSVTFALSNLKQPIFNCEMKCNLDWDAWTNISKLEGDFFYDPEVLMFHRVHEGSETTALIFDNTRTKEDLEMFKRYWPTPIAKILNSRYQDSQKSNYISAK